MAIGEEQELDIAPVSFCYVGESMTSVLLYTFGVVVFIFFILVSIGLHELGHLVTAKKFGTKVTDYFVGFGPTIWSRTRGETEYGLKAIPLGGFIRIIGMVPPDKRHPDKIRESNTGMFTQVISRAREADLERINPEDEKRLFYKLPAWKKFIVMAAGPSVNIGLAFIIFCAIFATYGEKSYEPADGATELLVVNQCVKDWDDTSNKCTAADPETAAYAAGLRAGDKVVKFNGETIVNYDQFQKLIQANGGEKFTAVVDRKGETLTLNGNTTYTLRPMDEEGDEVKRVGYLGITPQYEEILTKGGPLYTAKWMGETSINVFKSFKELPAKVSNVALAIVGQAERDPEGPVSVVGGSRFVGETVASEEPEDTVVTKTVFVFTLVGAFNLFIGLFNFIPLLPLDGGHMIGSVWEGLRRRFANLFHKPDPGPFDIAKLMPVAQGVGLMLFALGMILIVGDLVVPIRLQ